MNTNSFIAVYGLLFLLCSVTGRAQSRYQFGVLPVININKSLKKDWSLNFKWESRQSMVAGEFTSPSEADYEFELADYSVIASKKVGLNNSLAGGYLIRMRDKQLTHRAIQQFTLVRRYTSFRLAHRFSSDQTFTPNEGTELRGRYRITLEVALQGEAVDPKELYFKMSNEYLNSLQGKEYDLELRLVPLLGYEFTDYNKIEFGLDYRLDSFLQQGADHTLWININWFVSL